jgi:HEAT repeat protein
MAITMKDVRAWLDPEEPSYASAARTLGAAALPFLLELVGGGDLGLASKAASLASMIPSDKSVEVLEAAAATSEPVLRVAAAAGLGRLKPVHAERLLNQLKTDADPGVRKVMVKSAAKVRSPRVAEVLRQLAASDPEPFVRESTAAALAAMKAAPGPARAKKATGKTKAKSVKVKAKVKMQGRAKGSTRGGAKKKTGKRR